MRSSVVLFLVLVACGGSSAPPAAPDPEPAPGPVPAAALPAFEPTDEARGAAAVDFLAAVARRDRAAIAPMTGEAELCAIMERERPDAMEGDAAACTAELTQLTGEVLAIYEAGIPETFVAGAPEVSAIDADQGIFMVLVAPQGGGDPVSVILLETNGRRFVVFPRKK